MADRRHDYRTIVDHMGLSTLFKDNIIENYNRYSKTAYPYLVVTDIAYCQNSNDQGGS